MSRKFQTAGIFIASLVTLSSLGACATTPSSASSEKPSTNDETTAKATDDASSKTDKKPGNVHANYTVAHMILPAIFYRRPEQMVMGLERGDGPSMIADIWNDTAQREEIPVRVGPEDFDIEQSEHAINDRTVYILLIEFPEPHQTTHPFMTAMVVEPTGGTLQTNDGKGPRAGTKTWYFTLEKSAAALLAQSSDSKNPKDVRQTTFGGWSAQPAHMNFGDGPEDDREAFRRRILDHLAEHNPDSWHTKQR